MSKAKLCSLLLLVTAFVAAPGVMAGQAGTSVGEVRQGEVTDPAKWNRNGISVGRPKVFDNRTLTLRLETLKQNLGAAQFIDQKSVAAALGNFQGSRITDTSFAASISGPSLPGVTTTNTTGTAPGQITTKTTDASGNSTSVTKNDPNATSTTTNDSTVTTQAAQTPTAPTLPSPVSDLGVTLPFGVNSGDLLNDQVDLTYQIINLQMIAERSLSDRLWNNEPRRQAVLGFNVSVDPPKYAKDSAAVVEITIEVPGADKGGVSLVAMMPQEKSYNAAALNSKSNAFSGSAVVKAVNVGVAGRKSSKVMYLYKDNDTISYENMMRTEPKSQLQFGWIFRPVLGRRSVSPGMRQMFAVVALPRDNDSQCAKFDSDGECVKWIPLAESLTVKVRTYWKRYDSGTLTTASASQLHGWDAFKTFFSNTTELKKEYLNYAEYSGVAVESPAVTDTELAPKISSVEWTYTGAKSVVVSVQGKNFFPGTSVLMGGQTYQDSKGLLIKSDELLDILTDVSSLTYSDGVIVGRYGRSAVIDGDGNKGCGSQSTEACADLIQGIEIGPNSGDSRSVDIDLTIPYKDAPKKRVSGTPKLPIVLLNGDVVSDRAMLEPGREGSLHIRLWAPDDHISGKAATFQVIYPFWRRSTAWSFVDPSIAFQLRRLNEDSAFTLTAVSSVNFNMPKPPSVSNGENCWKLRVSPDHEMVLPTARSVDCGHPDSNMTYVGPKSILIAEVSKGAKDLFKSKFLLTSPGGAVYEVTVPPAKEESKDPKFDKAQNPTLNENDARWIDLSGTGLSAVKFAKANDAGLELRLTAAKKDTDKDKLQVFIPRSISGKAGNVDITFYDGSAKVIDAIPLKIACTPCKSTATTSK